MALIACCECGREVSNWARMYPHCGLPNPGTWRIWSYSWTLILLVALI